MRLGCRTVVPYSVRNVEESELALSVPPCRTTEVLDESLPKRGSAEARRRSVVGGSLCAASIAMTLVIAAVLSFYVSSL